MVGKDDMIYNVGRYLADDNPADEDPFRPSVSYIR